MKRTDTELIKEVLEGNMSSFGVLVHRYQGVVYGLAYHMVKNFTDAEDLAQEAFLRAYLELPQLRDPSKFAGWLRRITCNICNMWIRSQRTVYISLDAAREGNDADPISVRDKSDPAMEMERNELCEAVLKAVNSLSEKNRLAVTLFYMDGLSYRQISEFLEVPVTTIESRLHKARRQLKEEMIQMVEQDFSKKKLGPEFAMKVAQGTLEITSNPTGYGFIRQGDQRKDDIYVSPSQIRKFDLKDGDVIKGEAHPPREDKEEHYYALLYIQAVNGRDPRTGIAVENGETPKQLEPQPGIKLVEGVLELVPHLYGFIRQGGSEEDDIYVGPSQIRNFGLKTGDVIKGEASLPREDKGEHYYKLLRIRKVNNEDLKE